MDFSVNVDTDLVLNRLSPNGIAAYIGLLTHIYSLSYRTHKFPTNTDIICFYMTGKDEHSKYFHHIINDGLNELQTNGYIHGKSSNDEIIFIPGYDAERLLNPRKFVQVYLWEIQKIMNSKYTRRIYILKYFIFLLSFFHSGIGSMPLDTIAQLCGISKTTVVAYNKILVDFKIIAMSHRTDNFHSRPINVYTRYEDAEIIGGVFDEDGELIDI